MERGNGRERKAPPPSPEFSLCQCRCCWKCGCNSRCIRGRRREEFNFTHTRTDLCLDSANAKGNMQRSFTIICTSLLGICLGSSLSFPSNINIGENGAFVFPLHNLSCVTVSVLSSINSRLFADQQGGCSQPSRTNMRFFVSPSLTTRTSPNWCRRWIWLKWETASPWHMLVSIAGNLSILCYFFPQPPSSVYQLHKERLTPNLHRRKSPLLCAAQRRGLGWVASWTVARDHGGLFSPFRGHSVILRSISAASVSLESSLSFLKGCDWWACAFFPSCLPPPYFLTYIKIYIYIYIQWSRLIHVAHIMLTELCLKGYLFFNYIHFDFVCVCASLTLIRPADDLWLPCFCPMCASIYSKWAVSNSFDLGAPDSSWS